MLSLCIDDKLAGRAIAFKASPIFNRCFRHVLLVATLFSLGLRSQNGRRKSCSNEKT